MNVVDIFEHKPRTWVAPFCYLHDPSIPDEDKVQTLCHCWDHLDLDDEDDYDWGPGRQYPSGDAE